MFSNMLRGILLLSFLLVGAFASDSANRYVDRVLQTTLQQELVSASLLPAHIPDFFASLKKGAVTVDFTFGNITGLDRIKRLFDCSGPLNRGGEISINCTLTFSPLTSTYKTFIRNSTYTSVGKVEATLDQIYIALQIVGRPQNYLGLLKDFAVGAMGGTVGTPVFSNVPAYLRGNIPFLQNEYVRRVSNYMYNVLSQRYAEAFRQAIKFQPMPRQ